MPEGYRVTLTATLVSEIEGRSEADQDAMFAFVSRLRTDGFDVILGAKSFEVPGMDVEFVEPGEIPDMVWARFFLRLEESDIILVARQDADRLKLEQG